MLEEAFADGIAGVLMGIGIGRAPGRHVGGTLAFPRFKEGPRR